MLHSFLAGVLVLNGRGTWRGLLLACVTVAVSVGALAHAQRDQRDRTNGSGVTLVDDRSADATAPHAGEKHAHAKLFARAEGTTVRAVVELTIDKGWHIYDGPDASDVGSEYGKPTTPEITGAGFTWGDWRFPEPQIDEQDFGEKVEFRIHTGTIQIWRVGTKTAEARLEDLGLTITGQTCSEGEGGTCVEYAEKVAYGGPGPDAAFASFPKDLTATAGAEADREPTTTTANAGTEPKPEGSPSSPATTKPVEQEEVGKETSLLAFLLSAVVWGLFTLLMPCTYPMIPLTITYFTKQADARKTGTLPLSIAYGAGIVLVFVLIGLLFAPLIIPFATNPITNIVIGGFFLVFALTLFGVMNLQPPAFLLRGAGTASQKGGYVGVFLMGATLVVTSFTCTVPFVGTLLSTGAASGGVFRIVLGMAVFGLTMAVPFVFLSMVPARVKAIPKSGEWMHTLKVFLAFIEFAAALKFFSNADLVWSWGILSRELFLFLWFGIFVIAAAYLFGMIRLKDEYGQEDPATISPKRMLAAIGTGLFAVYCLYGALGHTVDPIMTAVAPPYSTKIAGPGGGEGAPSSAVSMIKDDYEAALASAKAQGKLLLVNFTGHTCMNCRLMEENVFPKPEPAKELKEHFVEARLHTDGPGEIGPRNTKLELELVGSRANPYYVVVDPKTGKPLRKAFGFMSVAKFLELLRGHPGDGPPREFEQR